MDNTDENLPEIKVEEISIDEAKKSGLLIKNGEFSPKKGIKASSDRLLSTLSEITRSIPSFSPDKIYRIDTPSGMQLMKSKEISGAFRGSFVSSGSSTIQKSANLIPVGPLSQLIAIGSLAFGQYYMSVINKRLDSIQQDIKRIEEFQNTTFLGKIETLYENITSSQIEYGHYIEEQSKRQSAIIELRGYRNNNVEYLNSINGFIRNRQRPHPSLKQYESAINEIDSLLQFQQILLATLSTITQLLSLQEGETDQKNGIHHSYLNNHISKFNESQKQLSAWHETVIQRLHINRKTGKLEHKNPVKLVANQLDKPIKSLNKKKTNLADKLPDQISYRSLSQPALKQIHTQLNEEPITVNNLGYEQPLTLYIKNNELYTGYP